MTPPNWERIYQTRNQAYFSIFEGQTARLSSIESESPMMVNAVRSLIRTGVAIGQEVFNEDMTTDTLVRLRTSEDLPPVPHQFTVFEAMQIQADARKNVREGK